MVCDLRRTLSLAGLLAVAAALAVMPGTARAAEFGTVPDMTWGVPRSDIDRTAPLMAEAGFKWARLAVSWSSAEPTAKGQLDAGYLGEIDYAVKAATAAGFKVLMEIEGVPYWASADPSKSPGSYREYYRPTKWSDFGDGAAAIVNRYKALGVHDFEVWNEPNLSERFWPSGYSPADYTQMLKAAYPAIKAADPQSRVVLGGLWQGEGDRLGRDYLAALYAQGAKAYFDVANFHHYPYKDATTACWRDSQGKFAADSFCHLDEMRNVMAANGDSAKRVWVTEFGWSTCNNSSSSCYAAGVSEAAQAKNLTDAMTKYDSSSYSYVDVAFVYAMRNFYLDTSPGSWEGNLGLLRWDYSRKPSFDAVKGYIANKGTGTGTTPGTGGTTGTTPPAPPSTGGKKRRTRTTLLVSSTSRRARGARAGRHARGRVHNANGGRVTIELRRWSAAKHAWVKAGRRRARVASDGTFATTLDVRGGRFRARARYGDSSSRAVTFRA